jgi:nicotinamidase-related amidase
MRPALVVIDLSRAFTDPTSDLGSDCSQCIDGANILLHAFRAAGLPIFFSTIAYNDPLTDAGVWLKKIRGLNGLSIGSALVEQDPRLARDPSDPILVKGQASCFFGTEFDRDLKANNVDTLIIAGVSTSGCVRATAVDGAQLGYRVVVAEEAVGDRLADAHQQSLLDINLKYGDVSSTADILFELSRIQANTNGQT